MLVLVVLVELVLVVLVELVLVELVLVVLVELVLVELVLVVLVELVLVELVLVVVVLVVPNNLQLVYCIARKIFSFLGGLKLSVQKSNLPSPLPTVKGLFILHLYSFLKFNTSSAYNKN